MEYNFRSFIDVYEDLDLPNMDDLKQLSLDDSTHEDVAAYARAIIQVHGRFGWTPLYSLDSLNSRSIGHSITNLANEIACLTGEDGANSSVSRITASTESYITSNNVDQLPHDESRLYSELLAVLRDETKLTRLLCSEGKAETQCIIDLVQHVSAHFLDKCSANSQNLQQLLTFPQMSGVIRSELLSILIRLSTATGLYPRSFKLVHDPQVNKEPITCGYFGDILRGYVQEQCVCVKVVKAYRKGSKSSKFLKVGNGSSHLAICCS